ncbi:Hsp20/alpha crystallin family protein [Patescibacteria group bacterium]|nr:Hsp20/alpha crystallin family protein [Patescibacteria group bacterium]MBU1029245.1 Hsp20/alpha crystallin family protein [Patescibacteria group bacterium]MBU1915686.1 Hsp20/alpha crystallin family protein [Patescibacteria group bacterium]
MSINIKLKNQNSNLDEILFPEAEQENSLGNWIVDHEEGQLAVDVYDTKHEIILRSAIAGVAPENLDVFLHNDMLTVRGVRHTENEPKAQWLVRECHWGPFSRSIILPSDIDPEGISAVLKDGILTVKLPKIERSKKIKIREA